MRTMLALVSLLRRQPPRVDPRGQLGIVVEVHGILGPAGVGVVGGQHLVSVEVSFDQRRDGLGGQGWFFSPLLAIDVGIVKGGFQDGHLLQDHRIVLGGPDARVRRELHGLLESAARKGDRRRMCVSQSVAVRPS